MILNLRIKTKLQVLICMILKSKSARLHFYIHKYTIDNFEL